MVTKGLQLDKQGDIAYNPFCYSYLILWYTGNKVRTNETFFPKYQKQTFFIKSSVPLKYQLVATLVYICQLQMILSIMHHH